MSFRDRLKKVREHLGLTQAQMAEKLYMPIRTYSRYESGEREPQVGALAPLISAGVNAGWLLTGEGPLMVEGRSPATSTTPAAAFDDDLYGRVVEGVTSVYKEAGARISPRDLGTMAARLAARLTAAYDDPAERLVGLKLQLEDLRRDLRSPPSGEASDKLSA